ncbi:NifU-like protein 5, mitochondrial [Trebouxia sp. C0010 RCD-2024]
MKRAFAELSPRVVRGLQTPQARAVLVTVPAAQATQWQAMAQLHSLQTHHLNRTLPSALGANMQQKRGMFIQTQPTPNPSSMMFLPGKTVMESGSMQFGNARESMKSPLAKKLFQVDGVTSVFFGSDFVTVTKSDDYTWNVVKPDIFAGIMDHFTSGEPLISDTNSTGRSDTAINDDDSEVVAMIKELLETRIRPAVMEDGGDIVFKGFDEASGLVTLKMQGACSGCPSSSVTLKGGIENMLMHYIPEVKSVVEAEPDESEVAGMTEFNKLEQHLSA